MKGLSSASSERLVSTASLKRTEGVSATAAAAGVLFLVLRADCSTLSCSVSIVSVSDTRGAFVDRRVEGVLDRLVVLGVGSTSASDSCDLLFLLLGVFGGGIFSRSSLSFPSTVPS